MPLRHSVTQGECISSIAYRYGFIPSFLWDHPDNKDLAEKRESMNVLLPGDIVVIPEKELAEVACDTGRRHTFRRKSVPEKLRFQFLLAGEPRADEPYRLEIDDAIVAEDACTDGEGRIEHSISPNARVAKVRFLETEDEFVFSLGQLDPIETIKGVKGRLECLGFYVGTIDGIEDDALRSCLETYQIARDLEATGEIDDPTRDALMDEHGA